jgi:hypothetical protein
MVGQDRYYIRYLFDNDNKPKLRQIAPSATTVVSAIKNDSLDLIVRIKGENYLNRAAERGTLIHNVLQNIIENGDINVNYVNQLITEGKFNKEEANDIWSKIFSLLTHEIFQKKMFHNVLTEQTLFGEIDGCLVAGTMDYYDKDNNILVDWKSGAINELGFHYEMQMSIYAELCKQNYKLTDYPTCMIVCPVAHNTVRKNYASRELVVTDISKKISEFNLLYKYGDWDNKIKTKLLNKKYVNLNNISLDNIAESKQHRLSEIDILLNNIGENNG